MKHTNRRKQLRAILGSSRCVSPASVFDPLSSRIAQLVGFEICMMAGSTASKAVLGAPDLGLITLTEFAEQTRRITRVCELPLLLDADNGYGNALNVMRSVQELEDAGAAALSIEDTVLPRPYGVQSLDLISVEEAIGKIRAARAARSDPELIIAARTQALKVEGLNGAIKRAQAYAKAGADAIFLIGVGDLGELEEIHSTVRLPIILGQTKIQFSKESLAERGARILLQGHLPIMATMRALRETYSHLYNNGSPSDLVTKVLPPEDADLVLNEPEYQRNLQQFLGM